MRKNLLNKEECERLIQRVQSLRPDTKPQWGKMTPAEMLLHVNKVHQLLLSPPTSINNKTSLKQYLIRWVVLYLMPRYPQGAKAPKQLVTKGSISDAAFEEQKQAFAELLRRLAAYKEPIKHHHPYFGALSTEQWGLASWKHVDHHLRQFGM